MEKHCSKDDIAWEILTWLPAKSLMRFKCISKDWNSCIGHPNFAKLHKVRSQARPSGTRLLFELHADYDYSSMYPATKQRPLEGFLLEITKPPHQNEDEKMFVCSNHCNGLVCLFSSKNNRAYLYNVTTREIKVILPLISVNDQVKYPLDPVLFLGFDIVTEKYKLLYTFVENKTQRVKTKILTLGTNTWRKIIVPANCSLAPTKCIFLDGVLYSIDRRLTYFNFVEEKFGNLPLIQDSFPRLNIMQTVLWGKLVVHFRGRRGREDSTLLYDDLDKVFTENLNNSNSEKVALIETEGMIDKKTHNGKAVLATASIISAPTSLLLPDPFILLTSVSSFVDNIIPLTSLF